LPPSGSFVQLTNVHVLQQTFVNSFHTALLVCAAFAALGIFTALARGNGATVKKE
jgi:hypothetical protein